MRSSALPVHPAKAKVSADHLPDHRAWQLAAGEVVELCSRADGITKAGASRRQSLGDGSADICRIARSLGYKGLDGHLKVPQKREIGALLR